VKYNGLLNGIIFFENQMNLIDSDMLPRRLCTFVGTSAVCRLGAWFICYWKYSGMDLGMTHQKIWLDFFVSSVL
jgi:hypothetical protein